MKRMIVSSFAVMALAGCQAGADADADETAADLGSIHAVMVDKIVPTSELVWGSFGVSYEGDEMVELAPATDEEWAGVEQAAMNIAEGSKLLQAGNLPVKLDGETIQDEGTQGTLTPAQIQELIDANQPAFAEFAKALEANALEIAAAAKARDAARVEELGGQMDSACENCHVIFWYPS